MKWHDRKVFSNIYDWGVVTGGGKRQDIRHSNWEMAQGKKQETVQEIEMEGVGRLQAKQTPQWIVGREQDVRWGGGIGKHIDPPPPAAGCCPRVWPHSPLLSSPALPYNTTVNTNRPTRWAHTGVTVYPACYTFTVETKPLREKTSYGRLTTASN